jgi:nucleoside-diphosphate-sugar epimerase
MQKTKVLITGAKGYIGRALVTALLDRSDLALFTVDNNYRAQWVRQAGGKSLTAVQDLIFMTYPSNLAIYEVAHSIIHEVKPDVIVHLASQPSAPYANYSAHTMLLTQRNNMLMLLNLLGSIHKEHLNPKLIVTTTTGIPGSPKGPITEDPMANLATSFYHVSRGFDSANLHTAAHLWKHLRVLELRTSIVYGTRIYGHPYPVTRFDWDYYFGVVIHRFCLLHKMGQPLTVFGAGQQEKPIITLRDAVYSLINAIDAELVPGHEIVNQMTQCLPIVKIAAMIGGLQVEHIPNPRVEDETYKMDIRNEKFLSLLDLEHPAELDSEVEMILQDIQTDHLPTNWKKIYGQHPLSEDRRNRI